MSSHDHACTPTQKPCESFTPLDYAMITHSIVGFKPKKFELVHQTIFLMRGVVWAQDYELLSVTKYH